MYKYTHSGMFKMYLGSSRYIHLYKGTISFNIKVLLCKLRFVFSCYQNLQQSLYFETELAIYDSLVHYDRDRTLCQSSHTLWQSSHFTTELALYKRACTLWQSWYFMTELALYNRACTLWHRSYFTTESCTLWQLALYDRACTLWQSLHFVTELALYDRAHTLGHILYFTT